MQHRALILACLAALAGCTMELPGFLGREGNASGTYRLDDDEPLPDPVPLPLRMAEAERALHGVIVRVEGVAPTQGFHSAALLPQGDGPDAAGILGLRLVAIPPGTPEAVGAERTRVLTAAFFLPNLALRDLRGVRVAGGANVRTLPLRQPGT
jgi:hypothetical protein